MKNKILGTVMGAALLAGGSGVAMAGALDAENFSSTLTFTTNYTFRGTTFSSHDPAIQGSFDWGQGAWFAGAWATSGNANDSSGGGTMEVDYYFGWADAIGGVDLMVMPLWYTFPGQIGDGERNDTTFELWTTAGMGFDNLPGAPYVTLAANWSDEYFDSGDESLYTSIAVAFTLPQGFGIDFLYGHQDVGDDNDFFVNSDGDAQDYDHWAVGLTTSAAGFDFDVRYHENEDTDALGDSFALDGATVFTVSRSF